MKAKTMELNELRFPYYGLAPRWRFWEDLASRARGNKLTALERELIAVFAERKAAAMKKRKAYIPQLEKLLGRVQLLNEPIERGAIKAAILEAIGEGRDDKKAEEALRKDLVRLRQKQTRRVRRR